MQSQFFKIILGVQIVCWCHAFVYTQDGAKATAIEEELEAGMVGVNHPGVSTPESPFGGINESGYGSEGGIAGLDAFLRTKFVTEYGV